MTSGFSKSDLLRSPKRKSGVALSKAIRTYPQYTKSKTWHPRLICLLGQATAAATGVASGVETDPGTSRKQDVKVLRAFENAGITESLGTECQALAFGLLKSPLQAFGFSTLGFPQDKPLAAWALQQLTPRNDCGQQLPLRVTLL